MPPLTLPVLARAAQTGRLPSLARIAVVEERWADLELLLASLASPDLPGPELVTTLTVVREGLAALPPDREKAVTLCRQLALDLLQQRAAHLAGQWPQWQRLAGELFADLGKRTAAGQSFQQAGDHVRAAEEYGAAGDLEQMEACYAQAEQARVRQRVDRDVSWQFQDLVAQGRRWKAVALVEGLDPGHGDAASLRIQADQLSRQLCQGRQVALRLGQGPVFGLAPFPAVVGRDGGVQVRLRDPTVSRRHALLRRREADILVEDAGSRGGTRLQGLLISAPLPLRGTGELTFGEQERCEFQLHGKTLLGLRALTGIDRNSRWLIGEGPLPLTEIDARLTDLTIGFGERGPHLLIAAGAAVSVGGQRRTGRWDLAHGDEIDAGSVEGRLLVL